MFICVTYQILREGNYENLFLGKILNDDTALKEYKIDEKNFVVVMVTKVSYCS